MVELLLFQVYCMVKNRKYLSILVLSATFIGLLLFYYLVNPSAKGFFIKCPFKAITGLDCPGCGSQRALHALLHGDFSAAVAYNLLFVSAIPYVLVGLLFEWFGLKHEFPKCRKLLFGTVAIYFILAIIVLFSIFRNI